MKVVPLLAGGGTKTFAAARLNVVESPKPCTFASTRRTAVTLHESIFAVDFQMRHDDLLIETIAEAPASNDAQRRRWLFGSAVVNVILAAVLYAVTSRMHDRRGSTSDLALFNAIFWSMGRNLCSTGIILGFAMLWGWKNQLRGTLLFDAATSLLSLALGLIILWCPPELRPNVFGLGYSLLIASKATVLVRFALVNPGSTARAYRTWVFAVSLLSLASVTAWESQVYVVQADGAHYLLLTHSLYADRDFDLRNNYRQLDHLRFVPTESRGLQFRYPNVDFIHDWGVAVSHEHHTVVGKHGEEFLWHDIGPSIVGLPGYALWGRAGAQLTLALLGSILALSFFEMAWTLGGSGSLSLWAWMLFGFSAPQVIYSGEFFPEIMGAAATAWSAILLLKYMQRRRRLHLGVLAVLLAFEPWLCIRFWLPAAFVGVVLLAYLLSKRPLRYTHFAIAALPTIASLALFAGFDWRHFGTLLPNAGYHIVSKTLTNGAFWARPDLGLLGIFFDRAYGLIPIAPVFLIAFAGAWILFRGNTWSALAILVPAIGSTVFVAFNRYWFGGWAPPARYLMVGISTLPGLSVFVLSDVRCRRLALGLCGWGWVTSFVYSSIPYTRYPYLTDASWGGLFGFIVGGRWSVLFPSLTQPNLPQMLVSLVWLAGGIALIIYTTRLASRGRNPAPTPP